MCIFLLFPVKKWPPREQLPLIRKGEDYACSPFRSPTQKQHQKPHLLICNIFLHFLGRAMLCLKMCHHTTEDTEFLFHNTQHPKCSVDVNSSYPPTSRERCFPRFSRLHGSLSEQTQSWVGAWQPSVQMWAQGQWFGWSRFGECRSLGDSGFCLS